MSGRVSPPHVSIHLTCQIRPAAPSQPAGEDKEGALRHKDKGMPQKSSGNGFLLSVSDLTLSGVLVVTFGMTAHYTHAALRSHNRLHLQLWII